MMIEFSYLIDKYKLNITGVLHCGGSYGQERELYDKYVDGEVIWIEAIKEVFEKLRENIAPYPKQTAIYSCLSNQDDTTIVFNISNNESQSSSMLNLKYHEVIHPEVHYVDHVAMKTRRLDTLFHLLERNISKLNFLNLDLQGAELLALQGAGKLLNQFDYILTEVNQKEVYENCALVSELDEFLKDYTRVETGTWVGDSWTDALYIKNSLL
jgi:FkbM family methyltransferase